MHEVIPQIEAFIELIANLLFLWSTDHRTGSFDIIPFSSSFMSWPVIAKRLHNTLIQQGIISLDFTWYCSRVWTIPRTNFGSWETPHFSRHYDQNVLNIGKIIFIRHFPHNFHYSYNHHELPLRGVTELTPETVFEHIFIDEFPLFLVKSSDGSKFLVKFGN